MIRHVVLVVVVLVATLGGCLAGGPETPAASATATATPTPTPESTPELALRTWGAQQRTIDDGSAVRISGKVINNGEEPMNATMTVVLLNGTSTVAERNLELTTVGPEEQVDFSLDFDVDPDAIDGWRASFSR